MRVYPTYAALVVLGYCLLTGCDQKKANLNAPSNSSGKPKAATQPDLTMSAESAAAKDRLDALEAKTKLDAGNFTEITIQDGANVSDADIELFARLTELSKLQIYNCRMLNDELVAKLVTLKKLTSLALTNSVITDVAVEQIVASFPELTELDLSSNTNLTTGVMKKIVELAKLKSLILVQNRFNELSTRKLKTLTDLRTLDLRGNMEAGNMTLGVVGALPNLTSFKHRSTAVTDDGMEKLAASTSLENLLVQDFVISGASGQHLAKLSKLKQLEIFRCQGFDSQGVLGLKGLGLERLTLRDLPAVDNQALTVLKDLPKLKRLFLHELETLTDQGLANLADVKSLEQLDIWTVSKLTDATVDVIATLPNLRELSLRTTGITDAAIDKIMGMTQLQSLVIRENAGVTAQGLNKLKSKKWSKLDIGE
jgi:Leucine-rich repeat (LRR) protein